MAETLLSSGSSVTPATASPVFGIGGACGTLSARSNAYCPVTSTVAVRSALPEGTAIDPRARHDEDCSSQPATTSDVPGARPNALASASVAPPASATPCGVTSATATGDQPAGSTPASPCGDSDASASAVAVCSAPGGTDRRA